jgi:hypothetical protein
MPFHKDIYNKAASVTLTPIPLRVCGISKLGEESQNEIPLILFWSSSV